MVPNIDFEKLKQRAPETMSALRDGYRDVGFFLVHNTPISARDVETVLDCYRRFFQLPFDEKAKVDMAQTGGTRGWGAPLSEQVDPRANPDYKEVFDCGFALDPTHPLARTYTSVYGANLWPKKPDQFSAVLQRYYKMACAVSWDILSAIADDLGEPDAFEGCFDLPMALLRGNFYPARPQWAGSDDYGIAPHTDYGCLTLLAADGTPGLEARLRQGEWYPITANPGVFVINFGEMLAYWSGDRIVATPHRVRGGNQERLSIPMFFNPNYEVNIAPKTALEPVQAGAYLNKRYRETYLHLEETADA